MVDSVGGIGPAMGAAASRRLRAAYQFGETARPSDTVEINRDVMRLRGVEGVRFEKVLAVKQQMDAGTYMTPERLDRAMDRVLDMFIEGKL